MQKKEIQNLIFPDTKKTEKKAKNNMEKNKYKTDINQLQIVNFQMENEIKITDSLIMHKNLIIFSIKFNENNQIEKIHLNNNYINIAKVSYILHNMAKEKRITFINTVNEKYDKEMKIKLLLNKISDLKFKLSINGNYNIPSIITEVSKEYIKSSILTDDSIILNKKTINEKTKKNRSNNIVNKNILNINPEKFKRKKYLYYEALSPKIINNITNNMKNYLNNKFNVNNAHSNEDKNTNNSLYSFNSSFDSNNLSCTLNNKMMIQELEELSLMENKKSNKLLYQSNDNSNTKNTNNSSNKNNNIYYNHNSNPINENDKQNQDDNYIFFQL